MRDMCNQCTVAMPKYGQHLAMNAAFERITEKSMRLYETISRERVLQLQRALQRWENEGGAGIRPMPSSALKTGKSGNLNSSNTVRSSWSSPRPHGGSNE